MERIPLHSWEMEFSIQYHVTINSQINDQNLIRYYIIFNIFYDTHYAFQVRNDRLYNALFQVDSNGGKVTSTTLEIHTTGIKDEVGNEDDQDAMTSLIAPAEPGTPVTLSGVIWKETMGGKNQR
jgi:hypothetical protein